MTGGQLSIFDSVTEIQSFETEDLKQHSDKPIEDKEELTGDLQPLFTIDQMVYVPKPSPNIDVEDFYYITDYANDFGRITTIYPGQHSFCYEVDFGRKKGIFREQDIVPYSIQNKEKE